MTILQLLLVLRSSGEVFQYVSNLLVKMRGENREEPTASEIAGLKARQKVAEDEWAASLRG